MIRIAALTSGPTVPSTRFRVRQYVTPLQRYEVDVEEYSPKIDKYARVPGWPRGVNPLYIFPIYGLWQVAKLGTILPGVFGSFGHQVTWLERHLLPGYCSLEGFLKRPLVLDVDDSIWLNPPFGRTAAAKTARRASVVIAGNRYLADWFSQYATDVRVVPTAIDTDRFRPAEPSERGDKFTVGWTGISANLRYLYEIEKPLAKFLKHNTCAEILIVCNERPKFKIIPSERVRFLRWSSELEATAVREMQVGIMPLPDNEWTRGKCSFKMLQYMASGIPVVVSPVGMNLEIMAMGDVGYTAKNDTDWYDALTALVRNRGDLGRYRTVGCKIVREKFSRDVIAAELAKVFRGLV